MGATSVAIGRELAFTVGRFAPKLAVQPMLAAPLKRTLAPMGALGLKGDAVRAREYYARALAAGVEAARQRIAALAAQQD